MSQKIRLFLAPVLLFTLALFICRLYLYFRYRDFFDADFSQIALAFLRGARFDLASSFIVSFPFLLAIFGTGIFVSMRIVKSLIYALLAWQVFLLAYNFGDIHFYADTQRHLTYDIFYVAKSIDTVFRMGFESFLWDIILFSAMLGLYALLYLSVVGREANSPKHLASGNIFIRFAKNLFALLVCAVITVAGIRGGIQPKPLTVGSAFASENEALGNLSLNGVYTTAQALYELVDVGGGVKDILTMDNVDYTPIIKKIVSENNEIFSAQYPFYRKYKYSKSDFKKMNVVIFMMESWSAKYIGSLGGKVGATPNFDDLAKEGLLATNCFANGQRTLEGVLATVVSFPTWNHLITGYSGLQYQTRLELVGSIFKKLGYETVFIHGGVKNTLDLNKLVRRAGFTKHISLEDFDGNKEDYDGVWGLYDTAAFRMAHEYFEKAEKPFFALVLSLSSHLPFNLPSERFDLFKTRKSPMREFLNSMSYSDYALGDFFDKAKKSGYYKNTLFVILGDHVAGYFTKENLREAYRIPCLFISSKLGLSGVKETQASQFDIAPTVLDLLRVTEPFTAWGKSIFHDGPRVTILPRGALRVFVSDPYMLLTESDSVVGLYNYRKKPGRNLIGKKSKKAEQRLAEKLLEEMRLYISLSEGLIYKNQVAPLKK